TTARSTNSWPATSTVSFAISRPCANRSTSRCSTPSSATTSTNCCRDRFAMFYSVRHVTRYRYDAPVRESIMQLYVQPKSEGPQRLQSFQITTHPRAGLQAYTDHFGNAVYHFDVPGSHQEL